VESNEEKLVRKSLKLSVLEGTWAVVFSLLLQGFVFTKIALEFGADEVLLGLILGIQLLSQVFQLFVPRIVSRLGHRKKFVISFISVSRGMWILFLVFPLLGWVSPNLFLIVASASYITGAFAGNAWTSWIRDLVPQEKMGRFFGLRNLVHSFSSLVFTFVFSRILDTWPNMTGVRFVLLIGISAGFASLFILSRQYEPPVKELVQGNLFAILKSSQNYRRLLAFGGFWNFSILFTAPFFPLHQLKNLNVNFTLLGYLSIVASLVIILFYWIWGRVADRVGHKNILRIGITSAGMVAFMWFFMTPETMGTLLWVDAVATGVGWSAINLAMFTLPLLVGGESASIIFGFFAAFNGVCGFAGSLVGGFAAKAVSTTTFSLGPLSMYGIQILFLISGVLRLISLFFLGKVSVTGHVKLRTVFFQKVMGINRRITRDLFEPIPRYLLMRTVPGAKKAQIPLRKTERDVL